MDKSILDLYQFYNHTHKLKIASFIFETLLELIREKARWEDGHEHWAYVEYYSHFTHWQD